MTSWKGQLAYKDINGMVWQIEEVGHALFQATNTEGYSFTQNHSIYDTVYAIDERHAEWTKETPSESIQLDQADKAAHPDLRDNAD